MSGSGGRGGSDGRGDEGRIDQAWYDDSTYFDGDTAHLTDLDSPFQRYRIAKVLEIGESAAKMRPCSSGATRSYHIAM